MDNHYFPNMYWLQKIHETPIKAKFIVTSSKSSIKLLAEAVKSALQPFSKQIENNNCKCRFDRSQSFGWYKITDL